MIQLIVLLLTFMQGVEPKATLEFRKLSSTPQEGWKEYKDPTGGTTVYADPIIALCELDIAFATLVDEKKRLPLYMTLNFQMTDEGAKKLEALTKAQQGKQVGIFLNNKLLLAPTIQSTVRKGMLVNGIQMKDVEEVLKVANSKRTK